MNNYIHPDLRTLTGQVPVLDLQKGGFVKGPGPYAVPNISVVAHDFDEYFHDLNKMEELRKNLHIPNYTYCAFDFNQRQYDTVGVGKLIAWARKRYEVRWWNVDVSGTVLICIADPVMTAEAGWEFYQRGKEIPGDHWFHLPAWWEFCMHGIRIPADWHLGRGPTGLVTATSPDKRYGMVIGGLTIT